MVKKNTISSYIPDIIIATVLIFLAIIMIYPMLYELFISFSEPDRLVKARGILLHPLGFDLSAYKETFSNKDIINGYKNTLYVMFYGLIINITLTAMGAYFLTRKNVFWKKPVMIMILITMYFQGGLVPLWLTIKGIGLYDNRWSLILPCAISTYNMILLKSYFQSIPDSLVESVMIDGGGHFTVLFKVFIPLSKPALMVMLLYYGIGHWNSWFSANMYLRNHDLYPLQLVLRNILVEGTTQLGGSTENYQEFQTTLKAAMVIVSTVPFLLIYPFCQKYFAGGLMIGSLKE
ncbi:MAG: carbohydrate ABC transporter permease [Lachnospiraceae bacterium]